jgi:hypothetical protein
MLDLDPRIFDLPLKESLQLRTSDLAAWTSTMFPSNATSSCTNTGSNDLTRYSLVLSWSQLRH